MTHLLVKDYIATLLSQRTKLDEVIQVFEEYFVSAIKGEFGDKSSFDGIFNIVAAAHVKSPKNDTIRQIHADLSVARDGLLQALEAMQEGNKSAHAVLQQYNESYEKVNNVLINENNLAALDAAGSKGIIGKLFALMSAPLRIIFDRKSSDLPAPREQIAEELDSMGAFGEQPANPESGSFVPH